MKKEERMHRLFGDIDDALVAQATRRPVRKAVWVPLVAAAACVALTVGLWQGGVFDPTNKLPVEPDEGTSTTESTTTTTEGTTTTAAKPTTTVKPTTTTKPTTMKPTTTTTTTTAKPTTTTAKSTTKTKPTKTTATTEPYILVGGEENGDSINDDVVPSLKDRLVSPALEEKMKEYRDVNAVFQVVVFSAYTIEDDWEADKFIEANEEYQSLQKQYEAARKAHKEALKRWADCEYPYDDPRGAAVWHEQDDADKKKKEIGSKINSLRDELFWKYMDMIEEERISYAAKYSKTEPIYGYGRFGNGYYMELTADAINELADRGGYHLNLASKKEDLSKLIAD